MVSLGPGRGHAIANTRQPVCVPPPVSLVVSGVTVRLDPVTLIKRQLLLGVSFRYHEAIFNIILIVTNGLLLTRQFSSGCE